MILENLIGKNKVYYIGEDNTPPNENDIIVKSEKRTYKVGWLPNPGQRIFFRCPKCKSLYEAKIGQGTVYTKARYNCLTCNKEFEDWWYMTDIFIAWDVNIVYSNKKYLNEIQYVHEYDEKLNCNISKVIGQIKMKDPWDITNSKYTKLGEYLKSSDWWDIIILNENDNDVLFHLAYYKAPLNNVYIINNKQELTKLNKINVTINIE